MSELGERECPVCHTKFIPARVNQDYCSLRCRVFAKNGRAAKRRAAAHQTRKCALPGCGRDFVQKNGNQKYCSKACMEIATGRRAPEERKAQLLEQRECPECHTLFIPRSLNAIFCSAKCGSLYRYRVRRETRAEARAERTYPPKPCAECGKIFTPQGRPMAFCSDECRVRNYSKKAHSKDHEAQDAPRQTTFGLNVDPYKTGRLRSDALYCPVI